MTAPAVLSYDVRIWNIDRYRGSRRTTYTLRWRVAGKRHQRTFPTLKLAEGFRAELLVAAGHGIPFQMGSGLPQSRQAETAEVTWLEHAMQYVEVKWHMVSARHRRGIAEALTDATLAVLPVDARQFDATVLRRALYRWAFNGTARRAPPPGDLADPIRWLRQHSPSLDQVAEPELLRRALDRLAIRQDGTAASPSTTSRKRATLHSVLEFAVELGLLPANPLQRIKWNAPKGTEAVDRRVVVNPDQARALLGAVWSHDPAVAAFFACLYYAGLRPAEARNLRVGDCLLPTSGWGRLLLTGTHQTAGAAWTDSATAGEDRALKHRSPRDTRTVPAHPELVELLQRHVERFAVGVNGRLFVTRTGRRGAPLAPPHSKPVAMGTIYRAWHRARAHALTEKQAASQLARRPYDLRHACLSTWLNAGVPPARVAEWAGHSVEVLLRVYAKCVEGDDAISLTRIENALGNPNHPTLGDSH